MTSMHDPCSAPAPDLIEPVIGFRQWRLVDGSLSSIACDVIWAGPTLSARCPLGGHPSQSAPAAACSCGIYAWYEPCPRTASAATRDYLAGAVVMWGAIELHMSGMRAEHCQIVALALPLSRWGKRDRIVAVAEQLSVPAVRHSDLSRIAEAHGAAVPASLRLTPRKICDFAAVDRRGMPGGQFLAVTQARRSRG